MSARTAGLAVSLAALMVAAGATAAPPLRLFAADSGRAMTLPVGTVLRVELDANYSTGSEWQRRDAFGAVLASVPCEGLVREPLDLSVGTKKLIRALKYVKATELDESLRTQFLLYMLWFCAHEAACMGLWDTACCMLNLLHVSCSMAAFALSEGDIQYQAMFFKICAGKKKDALALIDKMMRAQAVHHGSDNSVPLDLRQLWPQCLALLGFFAAFTGLSLVMLKKQEA